MKSSAETTFTVGHWRTNPTPCSPNGLPPQCPCKNLCLSADKLACCGRLLRRGAGKNLLLTIHFRLKEGLLKNSVKSVQQM